MTDQEHKAAELSTESNGDGIVACWVVKELDSPVKWGTATGVALWQWHGRAGELTADLGS